MAFFLLGRVDDTLTLLSPDTFASRQDAMGALSRITAEPGFLLWDAEVLLLDTDSGNPVLLMRPAVVAQPVPVVDEPASVAEVDTVLVAEVGEEPLETVLVEEPPVEMRSLTETVVIDDELEAPVDEELDAETASAVSESPDESGSEAVTVEEPRIEPVSDSAIADAIIEDQAAEQTDVDEPDTVSLKDALTRTTAHMEAEGIVAPESIASSEQAQPAADSAWPWDTSVDAPEEPADDASTFVLSDLEEPSLDDRSILQVTIDDEMFAAARPVIMGAYADPAPENGDVTEVVSEIEQTDSILADLVLEPMGLVSPAPPVRSGFAVPVVGDAADVFLVEPPESPQAIADVEDASDFILDLEQLETDDATPPVVSDLDDYTCKDCVYEETCPNKDQRLPKDCGSFQWR